LFFSNYNEKVKCKQKQPAICHLDAAVTSRLPFIRKQ